jgi:hypothetical protein
MSDIARRVSRVALALAGGAPGVSVFVIGHPVLGGVLLIVGETLTAIGVFTGQLVDYMAGKLREHWRDRLFKWIDRMGAGGGLSFDRTYRRWLFATVVHMEQTGLTTQTNFAPKMDDLYIDLTLDPRPLHQINEELLTEPAKDGRRHKIWKFLDPAESNVLVIIGVPGSGKTTLLHHTAKELCQRRGRRGRNVPILLHLRDHVSQIMRNPDVPLASLMENMLSRYHKAVPADWFAKRLVNGRCVILLDGLDEVADEKDRRTVAAWVDRHITAYPDNDFVITSRPQGYQSAQIAKHPTIVLVRGFTNEQVRKFIYHWYRAVNKYTLDGDPELGVLWATGEAEKLIRRLDRAPALYDLTVNPLLLNMPANVHHYRGALPGTRAELYKEICEAMLWRRQLAKSLGPRIPGEQKQATLRQLAFEMMKRGVGNLSVAQVVEVIAFNLKRMGRVVTAEDFLADVSSNGLLTERISGVFSFSHLTFQEFLAASHVKDKGLVDELARNVDNAWWRETTLLYAARSEADAIVKACLASGSASALSLAFDCVDTEEGTSLEQELRDRLNALLESAFTADTSAEHRRLMATVLVNRHLRSFVLAGHDERICARPIGNRIYWLYLQDTRQPAPDRFPAEPPTVDSPVVGVWRADAIAFTGWINRIAGGQSTYKLPTLHGIEQAQLDGLSEGRRSAWVYESERASEPVLWIGDRDCSPYQVDSEGMAKQIQKDILTHLPALFRLLLVQATVELRATAAELNWDLSGDDSLLTRLRTESMRSDSVASGRQRTKNLHKALSNTCGLAKSLDLAQCHGELLESADMIARSRPTRLAFVVEHGGNVASTLLRAVGGDFATCFALDEGALDRIDIDVFMGVTLSESLQRLLKLHTSSLAWPEALFEELVRRAHARDLVFDVAPDALRSNVKKVHEKIIAELGKNGRSWAARSSSALHTEALPIATRQAPPTAGKVAALRLAAFCLAAEGVTTDDVEFRIACRAVIAGLIVLERRARGELPVTETIVLAHAR